MVDAPGCDPGGRGFESLQSPLNTNRKVLMKVIVYHSYYGCDTGCCGHTVELINDDGSIIDSEFQFGHPYSAKTEADQRAWAIALAKDIIQDNLGDDHTVDLDWDNCIIGHDVRTRVTRG